MADRQENTQPSEARNEPASPGFSPAPVIVEVRRTDLGNVQPLPAFLASAGALTLEEQRLVVDEALDLIQQLYVHLPLKRAMHAIDPVQSLRLLARQLAIATGPMKERLFHNQMIGVFTSLRDLHTNYILPEYFASAVAFLPFYIEELFEDQNSESCEYVVSKTTGPFDDPQFIAGVRITYWNAVPIHRAIEVNAEKNAGSNPDARHARGIESMTIRPMAMSLPPDEEWVVMGYESEGKDREIRIPWQVWTPAQEHGIVPRPSPGTGTARAIGMDFQTETVRRTKLHLFVSGVADTARTLRAAGAYGSDDVRQAAAVDLSTTSSMPDVLSFRTVDTPSGKFAYLRIFSFAPSDGPQDAYAFADAFLNEVVRILRLLPKNGLILDVRGNGGGVIMAGERLLRLFTPRRITPALFDFINTPGSQMLVRNLDELAPWRDSIDQAVETGATYSQGFPLTDPEEANSVGQVYQGPVVLITDALTYSTTDVFTGGFRDHKIGTILGSSGNTGAGGANVWGYADIQQVVPELLRPLPRGTSMRVAIRRSTRVGPMAGVPLEDLGVVPEVFHKMTRNDLFNGNADLIAHAASILKNVQLRSLSATIDRITKPPRLAVQSQGITRVDIYVDKRPAASLDVTDGSTTIDLPLTAASSNRILLQGFQGDEIVTTATVTA